MTPTKELTDERLAEILAELEGVTPGPYDLVIHPGIDEGEADDVILWSIGEDANVARLFSFQRAHGPMPHHLNGKHFTRCDPDTIRALIEEVQASRRQPPSAEWRGIETAPRDGTPIIGAFFDIRCADSHRKHDIVRCWYQPEFEAFISSCRLMQMAPGYTIDGATEKLHSPVVEPVTHWMPLREPTEAEPTPGGDGCYCTHHPDDPAHGPACYIAPNPPNKESEHG